MEYKQCNKCGKLLPLNKEYFPKSKGCKDGYRNCCKECRKKQQQEYRQTNKETISAKKKTYRKEHREHINQYTKEYINNNKDKWFEIRKRYREKHRKEIALSKSIYEKNNRDKVNVRMQRRRNREKNVISTLTNGQWIYIKETFNNRCAYCGRETNLEQEHFIALSKGGEHTLYNIIPSCRSCNASKCDKDFFEWYPKQKFYSNDREISILQFLNSEKI